MSNTTLLVSLLTRLLEARAKGEAISPLELCGGDQELAEELERLATNEERARAFLRVAGRETPPPSTDPATPPGNDPFATAPPEPPSSRPRLGPFELRGVLGGGGMGVVHRAFDPYLGREVALKVMRPEIACRADARDRFLREARAAAAVRHDHVVPIYQVGEDGGTPYIAMPLLEGESLEARLQRERALPVGEVVRIGLETAQGLAAAHDKGLIHRDVKPGNLWLEAPEGRVKVLDFGLARAAEGAGGRGALGDPISDPGAVVGSPGYMSPEQVNGERLGARSDLFSLGCVLYRIATGTKPFPGNSLTAVLRATVEHQPPPTHAVNPEVPVWLSTLVARLLAKRPEDRPDSARTVADLLRAGAAGSATTMVGWTGAPAQWPPLPAHYVRRPDEEERLAKGLLQADDRQSFVVSAVFGLGGIGKSTLVSAVVQRAEVQGRFPDGVLWVTLGQTPEVLPLLGGWIRDLGDHEFRATDVRAASGRLRQLLAERAALLVVDDAWDSDHVRPFHVGGANCRTLVTTRRRGIADDLGAARHELDVLGAEQAVELLASRVQRPLQEGEATATRRLVAALGYLPLAIELAAVRIDRKVPIEELLDKLNQEVAALEALEDPAAKWKRKGTGEGRPSKAQLEASLQLSLRALHAEAEEAWRCFVWLGVLPDDTALAAPMATAIWDMADPEEADGLLEYLWGEGLLQATGSIRLGGQQWRVYRIHDLLHDCARRLLTGPASTNAAGKMTGLGLSWEEAHAEFLGRYRRRTRERTWHALPADGYVHGRLSWHLERAGRAEELHELLREETAEGRNGWYEANEGLGQPAVFAEDVARAWRLADESFRQGDVLAPGRQCRYALVMASLNSLAGKLTPKLLEALVKRGIWSVGQGLTYARRTPHSVQKAAAFGVLVPLVLAEERLPLQAEALRAALAIGHEGDRGKALSVLAPHLPPDLLAEVLKAALAFADGEARATTVAVLVPLLPPDLRKKALQSALAVKNRWHWRTLLSVLVARMSPEDLGGTLTDPTRTAAIQWDRTVGLNTLSEMTSHLPGELLEEALETGHASHDEEASAGALLMLAPHLSPELRGVALKVTLLFRHGAHRGKALAVLAPHLSPDQLREAIWTARFLGGGGALGNALAALAPYLTDDLQREALDVARTIVDEAPRASAICAVAAHLPVESRAEGFEEALRAALEIADEAVRAAALSGLAPYLPADLLAKALDAAHALSDEAARADALTALAPCLPGAFRQRVLAEALQAAIAIGDEDVRASALLALAPNLPMARQHEALEATLSIRSVFVRVYALSNLIPHLPRDLRGPALNEAVRTALNIAYEHGRVSALAELVPRLPPTVLAEVLKATLAIRHRADRVFILTELIPHLPADLRGQALIEALRSALTIGDGAARSSTLARIAPDLRPKRQSDEEQENLPVGEDSSRSAALTEVVPLLLADCSGPGLAKAIRIALGFGDEGSRAEALARLADHLPDEQIAEALDVILDVQNGEARAEALIAFARRLPEDQRESALGAALRAARSITNEAGRAMALSRLASHLPARFREEVLGEALPAACALVSRQSRATALTDLCAIVENVRQEALANLWPGCLHVLASRSRQDLFADLRSLLPLLARLAGAHRTAVVGEVGQAILDVCRWWP